MIINRDSIEPDTEQEVALQCIEAGIQAAKPSMVIENHVALDGSLLSIGDDSYDLDSYDDVIVVGGGNGGATVASALETVLGDRLTGGVVVTDHPVEMDRIDVLPADHPVPSSSGVESTRTLISTLEAADAEDLVLFVITGGGSALMTAPAGGLELSDLQATTERLLASGATIDETNAVRKHCSALKGGQLAVAADPATVVGLVFSDVVGNRLDVIASGPLAGDDSTYEDAVAVLDRYDLSVPSVVEARLRGGVDGGYAETPTDGHPAVDSVRHYVLADGTTALHAAAEQASRAGYRPLLLSSRIRGEAREAAKTMAAIAEECVASSSPVDPPAALLSGGETTVTLRGDGVGGPNLEFALSAAIELTAPEVTVASVDTDGIDGSSDAAGGITTARTATPRLEAHRALSNNDAGGFLESRGGLIRTGATGTNVNDLRIVIVSSEHLE